MSGRPKSRVLSISAERKRRGRGRGGSFHQLWNGKTTLRIGYGNLSHGDGSFLLVFEREQVFSFYPMLVHWGLCFCLCCCLWERSDCPFRRSASYWLKDYLQYSYRTSWGTVEIPYKVYHQR